MYEWFIYIGFFASISLGLWLFYIAFADKN